MVPAIVHQHLTAFDNLAALAKNESGGIVGDLRVTESMFRELAPSNPAAILLMDWMTDTITRFEALTKAVAAYGASSTDIGK